MKQKTIKLSQPVEWAGQTYTQLTLRKLKVKHMLEIDVGENSSPLSQYASLIAASAGVDVGVVHELDMEDFSTVQEALENFSNQGSTGNIQSTQGK